MPGSVLRDVVVLGFTWLLSLPLWGRCGRASLPLHHPTVCGHKTRGQRFLSDATLSRRATVGGGAFPGAANPPILDI
jgi:hypothetical protein